MPRKEKIDFDFVIDTDNDIEKLMSSSGKIPHAGGGGEFKWTLTNLTGDEIEVSLRNFVPPVSSYLEFIPSDATIPVDSNSVGLIKARIIRTDRATKRFRYNVRVNDATVDPELEIDGSGTVPPASRTRTINKRQDGRGGRANASQAKREREAEEGEEAVERPGRRKQSRKTRKR
jgi:hypothetical protein